MTEVERMEKEYEGFKREKDLLAITSRLDIIITLLKKNAPTKAVEKAGDLA